VALARADVPAWLNADFVLLSAANDASLCRGCARPFKFDTHLSSPSLCLRMLRMLAHLPALRLFFCLFLYLFCGRVPHQAQ
jgi:hypothetical protein